MALVRKQRLLLRVLRCYVTEQKTSGKFGGCVFRLSFEMVFHLSYVRYFVLLQRAGKEILSMAEVGPAVAAP